MTQNTEQNVRTREDREQEIAIMLCKARGRDPFQMTHQTIEPGVMEPYGDAWCHYLPEAKAVLEWQEAEARGAEEQRWKDGEARDTPSAYVRPDDFYNDEGDERCGLWSGDQIGKYTLPLYTRPANIAALEAEIASLKEAEQLARADAEASKARVEVLEVDAARFAWVAENTGCFWYGLPGFGPVSGRSYADRMKDLRSAIDKNIARAALTREGGV